MTISLAAARVNSGYNQKKWAEMLNVTVQTIVSWEKRRTDPDFWQIKKISELSGIPIECLECKTDKEVDKSVYT